MERLAKGREAARSSERTGRDCVPDKRIRKIDILVVVFVAILLRCTLAVAGEMPVIRPVSAVEKGALGIGKTVVSGMTVEEFGVEVLGVVAGTGPSSSLILVRTYGPLIERTGGIAAGMSGSPVFIEGELIGALAYGFSMADHTIGLVTPIDDMLPVAELLSRDIADDEAEEPVPIASDGLWSGVVIARHPAEAEALRSQLPSEVGVAVPLSTPLAVSGLGRRTQRVLESSLNGWSMFSVPGGKAPEGVEVCELEPGSAIGVQLVKGDVDLTALGTVTFVDGQTFMAFGHPFLNRGSVDFFAAGAYVHEVVSSIEVPFKIGAPLEAVGRLTQDRQAGVAGRLGELPQAILVEVDVYDAASERLTRFSAEIAHDETLTVPLLAITLLEAFDRGLDRIGPGTATVMARVIAGVEGMELPRVLARDNLFYSASDISAVSLGELLMGLQKLLANEFAAITPEFISIRADIEPGRRTARIESARAKKSHVVPGEVVEIEVSLRPFREEPISRTLPLRIPEGTAPGEVTIFVRAGGYGAPRVIAWELAEQLGESGAEIGDDEDGDESGTATDLSRFLAALFERDRNYEIVAEFYPMPMEEEPIVSEVSVLELSEDEQPQPDLPLFGSEAMPEPVKARLVTPYYIQGAASVSLEILSDAGNATDDADSTENSE